MEKAAPRTVCLLPDGTALGGNDSWIDYYNYTHHIPPAPSPAPKPTPSYYNQYLQIYAAVITTVLVIYGGSGLIRFMIQAWRRRLYQRMGRSQSPSTGVPNSPESPYESTTLEA